MKRQMFFLLSLIGSRLLCAATYAEGMGNHSLHNNLRACHCIMNSLESKLSTRASWRSSQEIMNNCGSLMKRLLAQDPTCVFEPFMSVEGDDSSLTTLWKSAVPGAPHLFSIFLESGSDLVEQPNRDDLLALIKNVEPFYGIFLEKTKRATDKLEKALAYLEEEGAVVTDITTLIRTFANSQKPYLQNYRSANGDTLLDETMRAYLYASAMQDSLMRPRHVLKLLFDLDVPVNDTTMIPLLRHKLQTDARKIDCYFLSMFLGGLLFFSGIAAMSDPIVLLSALPIEFWVLIPIFLNRGSYIALSRHLKAWEQRKNNNTPRLV